MKTLCLNMIVKNEANIILKCFDSIVDYIDYWVISDTGSTDGTQDIIKNYFKKKNIKGELIENEWVNFGYNRTISIKHAYKKADYILLLDADFTVIILNKDFKNKLYNNSYLIKYTGNNNYRTKHLVSGKIKWKYVGVTHEYITCDDDNIKNENSELMYDITFTHSCLGNNRTNKFKRDIELLTEGIKKEPNNDRYYFYLANSYYDIEDFKNSIQYYKKRIELGGWEEEVYYSMYKLGLCYKKLNYNTNKIINQFMEAFYFRPTRLESLYEVILYYRTNKNFKLGFKYGILGYYSCLNYPNDILFINDEIHKYNFIDELAICSYYVNNNKLAIELNNILITKNYCKERILKNVNFSLKKI